MKNLDLHNRYEQETVNSYSYELCIVVRIILIAIGCGQSWPQVLVQKLHLHILQVYSHKIFDMFVCMSVWSTSWLSNAQIHKIPLKVKRENVHPDGPELI